MEDLPEYTVNDLPKYLKDLRESPTTTTSDADDQVCTTKTLGIQEIKSLPSKSSQYFHLLLLRDALTGLIAETGLYPNFILERAYIYEALGYADLAAADAFIVYTLCETLRSDEWVSDLRPCGLSGEEWAPAGGLDDVIVLQIDALVLLYRSMTDLGASQDAKDKLEELKQRWADCHGNEITDEELKTKIESGWSLFELTQMYGDEGSLSKFGCSRREIYPWNEHEPDRNSEESIQEINTMLKQVAPEIEAKVTALPALNEDGSISKDTWHQLGLFATKDLPPSSIILREKSILTGIRPLDDALCDACGANLESISRDQMRQCPGEDCDTTFCSEDCARRAAKEYHTPNILEDGESENQNNEDHGKDDGDENEDTDNSPSHAPFCANTTLQEIGRTTTTTTPEWDLYFLLLTRTIQMSLRQNLHPLSLPSTKYLWGDFQPVPQFPAPPNTRVKINRTLPWSLHHNLTLPLLYFETLSDTLPDYQPYSGPWLRNFDWWIQSTLLSKFRGVANAQQSTFDGKAEIAAVHPLWCLANHSCAPNVRWTPTGERVFIVRGVDEVVRWKGRGEGRERDDRGIKRGEEIWSHYTDVRLGFRERRERLVEVLGGVCRCERCLYEAREQEVLEKVERTST